MFSVNFKARMASLALIGAAFAIPGAVNAGVVVKSTGPSSGTYPVGRQVADNASITLRQGDKITVLTDSGTRVMQGPGTFNVGEGATRTRARFSSLTQQGARRVRTGAVRSGDMGEVTRPNIWLVDVNTGGPMCVVDLAGVRLWRPEQDVAQTYSIVNQATQDSLDVAFVGTEAVRAVDPNGLVIADGTSYRFTAPVSEESGEASSVVITFKLVSEEIDTPAALASALYSRGCTSQLELMANTAEAEAE